MRQRLAYTDGWKYRTEEVFSVQTPIRGRAVSEDWAQLTESGVLVIPAGYSWDGASGPTWDSPCTMRGSVVHDVLYQMLREGLLPPGYRGIADLVLFDLMVEDGASRARAWIWKVGLSWFGPRTGGNIKPVRYAPEA
ncbi:MAG: DUF1353 domain-containing protein [Xanthomonadales bacterium]|nr:DUF1353 domain-containing protein [Xanthomonadales bacterium]